MDDVDDIWNRIAIELMELDALDPAWDRANEACEALRQISVVKLAERSHTLARRTELDAALAGVWTHAERLESLGLALGTRPDAVEWDLESLGNLLALAANLTSLIEKHLDLEQASPRTIVERAEHRDRMNGIEARICNGLAEFTACLEAVACESASIAEPEAEDLSESPSSETEVNGERPPSTGRPEENGDGTTTSATESPVGSVEPDAVVVGSSVESASDFFSDLLDENVVGSEVADAPVEDSSDPEEPNESPTPDFEAIPAEQERAADVRAVDPAGGALERPELPNSLTPPLVRFEEFATRSWIAPDGQCIEAPWLASHFGHDLEEAAMHALAADRIGIVRVLCAAADSLGVPALFSQDDLDAAAVVWRSPMSLGAGLSAERSRRLAQVASGQPMRPSALALSALLEALRPSTTLPLSETDVRVIASSLELENPHLRELISKLLLLNCRDAEPVQRMRRASAELTARSKEENERLLDQARAAFARKAQTLATGGKVIKLEFARRVWRRCFVELIKPLSEIFTNGGTVDDHLAWDLDDLRRKVLAAPEEYARLADDASVRLTARDQMDKAMEQLVDAALAVIEAAGSARKPDTRVIKPLDLPRESLLALVESDPLPSEVEEFLRRIAVRALTSVADGGRDPWRLSWDDLCEFPELLLLVEDSSVAGEDVWGGLSPRWIDDPARAGAALLATPRTVARDDREQSLLDLHRAARETGRPDIAVFVAGAGVLPVFDRNQDRAELFELISEVAGEVSLLESSFLEADELGLAVAGEVRLLCQDARWLSRNEAWMARRALLFRAWIATLVAAVGELVDLRAAELVKEAESLPVDRRALVVKAVKSRRFGQAVEGRYGKKSIATGNAPRDRVSIYRDEARRRFVNPVATIGRKGEVADKLAKSWTEKSETSQQQKRMRIQFFDFLEAGSGTKTSARVTRKGEAKHETVELESLRKLFNIERLNPTFAPQIHQLSELVIASAGVNKVTGRTDTPESVVRSVTSIPMYENCLVIALAPGISEGAREQAISELRSREIKGAVIDDLDLCRLLSIAAGPRRWLGLMEIAFEQISWRLVGPFMVDDGQFVRREMFVGRTQEARDLALMTKYSRIFSGRRLGKSALLKFLAMQYQGSQMPSGNSLTTIYIGAAGSQPDEFIVSDIIDRVQRQFSVDLGCSGVSDPGERLVRALKKFASEHPTETLLIVLDEADVFVEEQLVAYDRKAESCLAFRMVKSFSEPVDKRGAPRIRFVVAGYRVTNTNYGPWFNSGDVLKLPPLDEVEAARLIEGPLARLGIDASAEARSIARRCGYQPAVLLKFGEVLLRRLHDRGDAAWRARVVVTRDDVVAVFHDSLVTEAIRYVIDQNFGNHNPVGAIVFTAFLWALSELPAAWCIGNAPETILTYIRRASDDTSWLKALDPTETGEIEHQLRDQVERQLLERAVEGERPVYRLKFPHLLPLLAARSDPAVAIRASIDRLLETGTGRGALTSVLPAESLTTLYSISRTYDPGYPVALAVVAGHWTAALQDTHSGIASRLGYGPQEILTGDEGLTTLAASPRLCSVATTPELAERILIARPQRLASAVASGGIDLLRWAVRHGLSAELAVDVYPLGRLTMPALAWWFERGRGHEFEDTNAIARIHQVTSGIPVLISVLDRVLDVPRGDTVTSEKLASVLTLVIEQLPAIAAELVDGPPASRLTARELELLRMIALTTEIGRESVDDVLCGDFWEALLSEQLPGVKPLYSQDEDRISLDVVRMSGLAPLDALNRIDFAPNDAVIRIVDSLGPR